MAIYLEGIKSEIYREAADSGLLNMQEM